MRSLAMLVGGVWVLFWLVTGCIVFTGNPDKGKGALEFVVTLIICVPGGLLAWWGSKGKAT